MGRGRSAAGLLAAASFDFSVFSFFTSHADPAWVSFQYLACWAEVKSLMDRLARS